MAIILKDGVVWEIKGKTSDWNPVYKKALLNYLNCLYPLFAKAKDVSEFEFICTLLRVRGLEDSGWDPWVNTVNAMESLMRLKEKINDFETTRHLFLWLYGHIVEASEPYEIVSNLINIIEGNRFVVINFPDKKKGNYKLPQSPSDKISELIKRAKIIGMPDSVFPFRDVFDRKLRNAIFHSDYVLYGDEVRLPGGYGTKYSHAEVDSLINKSLAYFESFKNLMSSFVKSYEEPNVISINPKCSPDPEEKAITIIRKGQGVVGLKDNWTEEEIKMGKVPFLIGRFMRYENEMLDRSRYLTVLPENRIDKFNKLLGILPKFIRKKIVKLAEGKRWF